MTNTRKLAIVAVLSALSFLLMLYEIPLITEFLKLDFSIIPILLALVVFVCAFSLLWKKRKSLSSYVKASLAATLGLTITMIILNVIYAVPLYARFAGFDINKAFGLSKYLLTMIVPFNLLEGVIWAAVFWLIYKLLQPVLKRYEK